MKLKLGGVRSLLKPSIHRHINQLYNVYNGVIIERGIFTLLFCFGESSEDNVLNNCIINIQLQIDISQPVCHLNSLYISDTRLFSIA